MAPTDHLKAVAAELLERLVATQGPGGHWGGPVLRREDLPDESSVAAFFVAEALHAGLGTTSAQREHRIRGDRGARIH